MPEHRIPGRSIYLLMLVLAFVAIAFDLNATGPDVEPYRLDAVHSVQSADFSPDGHFLALGLTQSAKHGSDTTFSNSIAIWDLNSKKIVANTPFDSGIWQPQSQARFLHYMPDGHRVAAFSADAVTVFDPMSHGDISRIDLGLASLTWGSEHPWVVDMKVAPVGNKVAVLITYLHNYKSAQLRVYDVGTKLVTWEWNFDEDVNGYSFEFSPDATKIAVAMPYPRRGVGLVVLDIDSSREVFRLPTRQEDPTARAIFATDTELLTVPVWEDNHTRRGSVKFWDLTTGKVTRQISASPAGIHYYIDMTMDRRYLLGYIGREKTVEYFSDPVDERFQIWDLRSGNVIATSGDIPGSNKSDPLQMRLSPDGRWVVAYVPGLGAMAEVFELPTAAAP